MKRLPQPLRFLIVGSFNTLASLVIFSTLFNLFTPIFHYQLILVLSHLLSVFVSFVTMQRLVFPGSPFSTKAYLKFQSGNLIFLGINSLLLALFVGVWRLPVLPSQIVILGLIAVVSYGFNRRVVFR
jgi:putative flippase GtrA